MQWVIEWGTTSGTLRQRMFDSREDAEKFWVALSYRVDVTWSSMEKRVVRP